jgi:hypothetical protein
MEQLVDAFAALRPSFARDAPSVSCPLGSVQLHAGAKDPAQINRGTPPMLFRADELDVRGRC